MKITRIRPMVVPNPDSWPFVIVCVDTDAGLVGYGDASLQNGAAAVVGALDTLRPLLIGQDPRRIEQIWQDGYRAFQMVRGGVVYMTAISGLDQALWDIKGKTLGVPVYQLLGGAVRDRVPAFRYGLPLGASAEETRDKSLALAAEGWRAFHGDPFASAGYALVGDLPMLHETIESLQHIRAAVGGRVDIAIDCHGRFTPASAVRVASMLEPVQPIWLEEPVPPENVEATAVVARSSSIPIACGERFYTRWAYRELFEKSAAAIIQPDVCHVGGISELRKVAAMAEVYYVGLAPHMIYSPLALAATLQVDACIPNLVMQGLGARCLGLQASLFREPVLEQRDGWLNVPQAPGLGVEIDEDKLARLAESPRNAAPESLKAEQWYRQMA
jgi:galactonate dehydratase